ncbi:transposase (plasmid) [Escherichia coli O10:H32]|nr:transposase [Escherichia coli O10:H32]
MLPSEILFWQPEFTDKTLSRKPGAVQWADRDGLCLFAKRLERGRFVWPVTREG